MAEKGRVKGLKARGNYVCNIEWKRNKLCSAEITAQSDGTCRLFAQPEIKVVSGDMKDMNILKSSNYT